MRTILLDDDGNKLLDLTVEDTSQAFIDALIELLKREVFQAQEVVFYLRKKSGSPSPATYPNTGGLLKWFRQFSKRKKEVK